MQKLFLKGHRFERALPILRAIRSQIMAHLFCKKQPPFEWTTNPVLQAFLVKLQMPFPGVSLYIFNYYFYSRNPIPFGATLSLYQLSQQQLCL